MVTLSGSSAIGFRDALVPVVFGFTEHAGNEIDVDLREPRSPREFVGAKDFRRAMRAAIQLEHVVVEILDAQAETRHAEIADDGELALGERAGLAFERHFLRGVPRQ